MSAPRQAMNAGWTDHALRTLARSGYRAGGARSAVIEVLGREHGCLTAEEVIERLSRGGRRVGTASVYRALGLLSELGLLHRVPLAGGPVRFDLAGEGAGDHHHHLVCERCGRTATFGDARLEATIARLAQDVDYAVDTHDVTLRGTCPRCARAAASAG